jgi:hypothetical protein
MLFGVSCDLPKCVFQPWQKRLSYAKQLETEEEICDTIKIKRFEQESLSAYHANIPDFSRSIRRAIVVLDALTFSQTWK